MFTRPSPWWDSIHVSFSAPNSPSPYVAFILHAISRHSRVISTALYAKVSALFLCVGKARLFTWYSVPNMLVRSARRLPPSLIFLLAFLAFLGWELNHGTRHEERPPPPSAPPPAPAPVEPEQKPHAEEQKPPRLALITFVTEQRSYLHLSLKNKDRELRQATV